MTHKALGWTNILLLRVCHIQKKIITIINIWDIIRTVLVKIVSLIAAMLEGCVPTQ